MPTSPQMQTVTIPLSGRVSGPFEVRAAGPWGITCPVVTSGQLFVLGSYDPTSANFVRLLKTDGSTTWAAAIGAGGVAVEAEPRRGFSHFKLETSVAQAVARTFQITVKV